jgi:hypothetical protein
MNKLYLEGTRTMILEDNREMQLDYYLVEECREYGQQTLLYGVKIVKHVEDWLETEYSDPISYSKDLVKEIIHKLWYNEVTLITMLEVVDDLVSICG